MGASLPNLVLAKVTHYTVHHHNVIHVLHGNRKFLASGLGEGLSQYGDDFSLAAADKEIVILEGNVNDKEVI